MKKKFVSKLILSGAALAVSAATLVSTTYAWYVQNSQVTATGVSGSVKDKDASSIFIAKNYSVLNSATTWDWLPTINYAAGDHLNVITGNVYNENYEKEIRNVTNVADSGIKVFNGGLDPVTITSSNNFVYPENEVSKILSGEGTPGSPYKYAYASNRVIEFNIYVQSNIANTTLQPYLIIANTTDIDTGTAGIQVTPQTAYRDIKYNTGASYTTVSDIKNSKSFWVDAVQALRMKVKVEEYAGTVTGSQPNWGSFTTTDISDGYYDVLNVAKSEYVESPDNTNPLYDGNNPHYYKYAPIPSVADGNITCIDEKGLQNESVTYAHYNGTSYAAAAAGTVKGAHAYYAGLVGNEPKATFNEKGGSAFNQTGEAGDVNSNLSKALARTNIEDTKLIQAGVAYKFTFTLWLEGTDPSCFDCCQNQTFNIQVYFDVK